MILTLAKLILRGASMNEKNATAAIVVIGDEILKGYTCDTNSHFICKRLFNLGVKVTKIVVIPDCIESIAQTVRQCSAESTYVLTSGGIGPTHDDMTFEGVAKAVNDQVVVNEHMKAIVEKFFGKQDDDTTPAMKLAKLPSQAVLLYGINKRKGKRELYPVVSVSNIIMLPGVPTLLERAFDIIEDQFKSAGTFFRKTVYVSADEVTIATCLTKVADQYQLTVNVGSYPVMHNSYYKVKICLDSTSEETLENAVRDLRSSLPANTIVEFDDAPEVNPVEKFDAYMKTLEANNDPLRQKIQTSMDIVKKAFETYQWHEMRLAFNGGKDCTALLHLLHIATLKFHGPDTVRRLKAIYFQQRHPFDEMEKFIETARAKYKFELTTMKGEIKQVMFDLKRQEPDVRAIFMGTRASDPHSHNLQAWAPTDSGWAEFMRVSPLIAWSYRDMWRFVRDLNVEYCQLYDRGYTSLGNKDDTHKNPSLIDVNADGIVRYRPAYTLNDETLERDGRE